MLPAYRSSSTRARHLPLYDGTELKRFIELADYVTVNDYEAKLLEERTGESVATLATRCKALIVTLGAQGFHDLHRWQSDRDSLRPACTNRGPHRLWRRLSRRHPVWASRQDGVGSRPAAWHHCWAASRLPSGAGRTTISPGPVLRTNIAPRSAASFGKETSNENSISDFGIVCRRRRVRLCTARVGQR